MRQSVVTYNPFDLATRGMPESVPKIEARFEIRARIQNQIDAIDRDIQQAIRGHKINLIESLTLTRNRLMRELP